MIVPQDTIGRIAIRLGRAFQHPWTKSIDSSAVWDWETAKAAIESATSKNRPAIQNGCAVSWGHSGSSTTWELRPSRCALFFRDKGTLNDNAGNVQLSEDSAGNPAIRVFFERLAGMSPENLWRFDRAVTSFSCDRWRVFYKMPPVTLLQDVLGDDTPTVPCIFWYVVDSAGRPTMHVVAKEEEHADDVRPAAQKLARLTSQGLIDNWHKMLVRKPA